MDGLRIETWEGANGHFKEQLRPETAFMYRRGLAKADLLKDTININITNTVRIGSDCPTSSDEITADLASTSSVLSDLIKHRSD